ncbi:low-density lipoprotein receptor-related protein 6-like [Ptychodera flava]|uniref:low-density lipoprotein receptor-related protein 6-like n=1 Tax=Ptychodera flava TaxID=63121 RepID=UPI00396A8BDF
MLDRPRGITVHPFKGYLYWCDLGSNRKIERSTLNGERRETIVSIETHGSYFIQSPSGLSIDYAENRLYWTDDGLNTVMSIDLDSPLEISEFYPGLRSVLLLPFDLTMDQDFVVVGDFSSTRLWLIDRGNQSITGWLAFNFHPIGVTYYTEWRQQTQQSPCSTNNGGCDQLCVSDPNGHKCLCSHGYVLDDDGKTCTVDNHQVPGHQILFSTSNSICRLPVTFGHAVVPVSENCFVQDVNATAMDYVYRQDALYVHDQLTGSIRKMTLREGETFVTIVQGVSGVKGIAVDWLGSNLYWTDAQSKAIFVSKLNGLHVTKLITENIENPRDIAVHSIKKILFWADSGSYPRIEKSMLSGRDRDVVVADNTTSPVALTIDYQRDRLYWYDANSGMMHSTSFDGKSQQPLVAGRVNLFGMDVFQDHLFWTEPDQNTITDFDLVSNNTVRIQSMSDSPEALIVFDKTIQTEESGPCDMFNGGCAEICVPTELGAECLCSQPQSASCRKVVRCPVDFYGGSIAPGCDNVNGNICPFICKNNFSPRLTGTLLCQDDGQWDTTLWILCKTDIILSDFLLVADTQGKIFHIDMQSPSLDYISLPLRDL